MSSQSQLNFPRAKTGSSARAAKASTTASSMPPGFLAKKHFELAVESIDLAVPAMCLHLVIFP
jgi:hypothetical protein